MEKTPTATILALALLTAPALAGGVSAESNEEQIGRTVDCNQSTYAFLVGEVDETHESTVTGVYGDAFVTHTVDVEAGTQFQVSAEDGSSVFVRFFDDQNEALDLVSGPTGQVPADATWGFVCVELDTPDPMPPSPAGAFPNPTTPFHYQDGF